MEVKKRYIKSLNQVKQVIKSVDKINCSACLSRLNTYLLMYEKYYALNYRKAYYVDVAIKMVREKISILDKSKNKAIAL